MRAALIVFFLFLFSCGKPQPPPEETFARIRLEFLHGALGQARTEADTASKRFAGHNAEWEWRFRLLEAEVLAKQGLSQEVLSLLDSDLPAPFAQGNLAVRQHMLRALADSHLGRFPEADQNLRLAQALCAASTCISLGEVDRIAGAVAAERDDADKADFYFRNSLQIGRQQGDKFLEASDLLNLGVVAIGREHFDESVDLSREAYALAQGLGAGPIEEKALGNLGWAYYKMGDFELSLDYFVRAAKKSQELGAVIDQVEWLNNQGLVYFQTAQFSQAENYYRQSLELARSSQNRAQIVAALTALAFVSVKTGQLDHAQSDSDEALQLSQNDPNELDELSAFLVQGQIAARLKNGALAEKLFARVAADPKSDASLRWQALDDLAQFEEASGQRVAAEKRYRESLSTLEAARSSLHREEFRLPFLANATRLYDDYVHFLVQQGKAAQALEIADYSRAQTLMEGLALEHGDSRLPASQVNAQKAASGFGGTILFYWLGAKESYLWAVTSRQTMLFRLPPRLEIEARVERYRKALAGPLDVLETRNPDGSALYDILVAPARKLIPRDARVLIIPDGGLNHLNFETLLVSDATPHYWIEDAAITNANSLRLLARSRNSSAQRPTKSLLLIGDALAANRQYGALPNAAEEMADIKRHFAAGMTRTFAGNQATPLGYLASNPEQFSHIHFVAHGTASELSPLDSAIVLSRSGAEDSFKLYARDIIQHPLHADLVTVSSCYGEGARAYSGEGLVGLSWAFLRAGAHNVIAALWEVSDTSTPQLMDNMYGAIEKGKRPEAALRAAKLAMLHAEGVYRKPFYWAPFQLYTGF